MVQENGISEQDFETQREVFYLLKDYLKDRRTLKTSDKTSDKNKR